MKKEDGRGRKQIKRSRCKRKETRKDVMKRDEDKSSGLESVLEGRSRRRATYCPSVAQAST